MKVSRFAKATVLLNCAVPVTLLGWDAWNGQLGANPITFAIHTTGLLALIFLILTLSVTPVARITGWHWLSQFRRMLGLFAFFHASLHFLIFFGLDRVGSISSTLSETIKRPYLLVGMVGLLVMVPLAVTSTDRMIARLGPKRWKALHRLAYVAAIAGVVHYYMLVKADVTQPLAFAMVLAALLGYRLISYFVPLRSSSPAALSSEPNPPASTPPSVAKATLTFARSGKSMDMPPDKTVLEASEDLGINIEFDCRSGYCGQCRIKLISGNVVMEVQDALDSSDISNNYILSCQARCIDQVAVEA